MLSLLVQPMRGCFAGGGAVSSALFDFMRSPFRCAQADAPWGSSELGSIGHSTNGDVYMLSKNVLQWKLVPYGPYRDVNRTGELWVRTGTVSRHADTNADWRYMDDGYVRTRNVVERVDPRHVRVVDKTSHIFSLPNGELVAVGELERRIEVAGDVIARNVSEI